jgi:hypothetical protein
MCAILAHMASIDPFKYDMLSDEEKTAYVSPSLTVYDLTKLKNKKNRKYENRRTDRSLELFPSFPSD